MCVRVLSAKWSLCLGAKISAWHAPHVSRWNASPRRTTAGASRILPKRFWILLRRDNLYFPLGHRNCAAKRWNRRHVSRLRSKDFFRKKWNWKNACRKKRALVKGSRPFNKKGKKQLNLSLPEAVGDCLESVLLRWQS